MLRRPSFWLLLALCFETSAWAANKRAKVGEYQSGTNEVTETAKARNRARAEAWVEADPVEDEQAIVPWLKVGMIALAFAIAAPFAWSAYRRSTDDFNASRASSTPRKRKTLDP